ncbi:hypothetical protein AN958_07113 [Leucoagaricus sp. SymC.cos]|nr:hypothetical protein AN958_07113 [Leucoagaricus sp. SymC.cos]
MVTVSSYSIHSALLAESVCPFSKLVVITMKHDRKTPTRKQRSDCRLGPAR